VKAKANAATHFGYPDGAKEATADHFLLPVSINNFAGYLTRLLLIGTAYFVLATGGLGLATVHPSATAIWPPSGIALAAALLVGLRVWPAIFFGAFVANLVASEAVLASAAIATGNTLEAIVGAVLVERWCGGRRVFDTPLGVLKFALMVMAFAAAIGASAGVTSLMLFGLAEWRLFADIWKTWWLGDVAGALVVTPVIVLWANYPRRRLKAEALPELAALFAAACAVGLIAFSPLLRPALVATPLTFIAVFPLLWAALYRGPRDTATVVLILCAFAVWGTLADAVPLFVRPSRNDAFLVLIAFCLSVSIPSLVLSAEVAIRRQTEARLRSREQELRDIFKQAMLGISLRAPDGRLLFANDAFCRLAQRAESELLHMPLRDLVDPEDWPRNLKLFEGAVRDEQPYDVEVRFVRPDGSRVWVHGFVTPVFDETGALRHLVSVSQDVTERRRAEERQRWFMAELDHRVRNILATVQSMLRLTGRRVQTKQEYAAAIEGRVTAMARAHSLLRRGQWEGVKLEELVRDALAAHLAGEVETIAIAGPECLIEARQALDLAMLLHELATNAAKYGALSVPAGRIAIDWEQKRDGGELRLHLRWQEKYGPPVTEPERLGFGTELIRNILEPHGAAVTMEFARLGVRFSMDMPLVDPGQRWLPEMPLAD